MIIKRIIDGKECEIKLTDEELVLASEEYDHSCYEDERAYSFKLY